VKQLMHAYGDTAPSNPASVQVMCAIVRSWVNTVYNAAVDNVKRTRKTAGKGWREHTGVMAEDVAVLLPQLARRYHIIGLSQEEAGQQGPVGLPSYSQGFLPNRPLLVSDGPPGSHGGAPLLSYPEQDPVLAERLRGQDRRVEAEYLARCREVNLVKHKKDRFRRFIGLRLSNPRLVEILGFIAQERIAGVVGEALKARAMRSEAGGEGKASQPLKAEEVMAAAEAAEPFLARLPSPEEEDELPRKRSNSDGAQASTKRFKESSRKEDDEIEYCICRMPEFGFMLECEGCNEWFHGKCVGVTRRHDIDDWRCPNCVAQKESTESP